MITYWLNHCIRHRHLWEGTCKFFIWSLIVYTVFWIFRIMFDFQDESVSKSQKKRKLAEVHFYVLVINWQWWLGMCGMRKVVCCHIEFYKTMVLIWTVAATFEMDVMWMCELQISSIDTIWLISVSMSVALARLVTVLPGIVG